MYCEHVTSLVGHAIAILHSAASHRSRSRDRQQAFPHYSLDSGGVWDISNAYECMSTANTSGGVSLLDSLCHHTSCSYHLQYWQSHLTAFMPIPNGPPVSPQKPQGNRDGFHADGSEQLVKCTYYGCFFLLFSTVCLKFIVEAMESGVYAMLWCETSNHLKKAYNYICTLAKLYTNPVLSQRLQVKLQDMQLVRHLWHLLNTKPK